MAAAGRAALAPNCPGVTPCGGSVVGTWTVTSSCLALSGDMDVVLASLGCTTVPVTGSLHVTGTWTANSDGTYTDNTVTTGSITFPLGPRVPVGLVDHRHVHQGGGSLHGPRLGQRHLRTDASGHVQLHRDGQPERRHRRDLPLGDDQRQLHDLGLRAQRRRHRRLLLLHLGKHADR